MTDSKALAEAFETVARVNHHLVGVVGSYTDEDLDAAEQILIDKQNSGPQSGACFKTLDLALDMVEIARRR